MGLLIDGYNLLYVTNIFGGGGPRSFERSRVGLLNFVASVVAPAELPRTTVVFDASQAPPGLPRTIQHAGVTAHFASDYESADELLEELIRQDHNPRQLIVVSSDHRVQRAANRRKATAIDSDVWYAKALRERHARATINPQPEVPVERQAKQKLSESDVDFWVKEFERGKSPQGESRRSDAPSSEKAAAPRPKKIPDTTANPFPPGYTDDLL